MANYEVRLSVEEIEGDSTPEVTVEFWNSELFNERTGKKGDTEITAFATAPRKGAPYDTVKSEVDVDGAPGIDAGDNKRLLDLVNAFMKMDLSIKS
ncbi:hypothetical protein GIV19_05155 [Pseudomonas syringae]|uniref:hypothetical protein n=1 Tax=Pseudomonas syringae TaxID=317 RepID=UPI001F3D6A03|nr:hypothetical protein [Pseudomonas syringae]MCF5706674.1 hypothetical protein [Pseudomonas syringae]